jgi:hypothetical protein
LVVAQLLFRAAATIAGKSANRRNFAFRVKKELQIAMALADIRERALAPPQSAAPRCPKQNLRAKIGSVMNESAIAATAVLQGVTELSNLAAGEGLNIVLLVFPAQIVMMASRSLGTTSEVVSNQAAVHLAALVGSRLRMPDKWLDSAAAPLLSERMAHYLKHPDEARSDDLVRRLGTRARVEASSV